MTIVVLGLGVALSLFAWLGLRSVEERGAEVTYERRLLEHSSELQDAVLNYLDLMDSVGSMTATQGQLPAGDVLGEAVSSAKQFTSRSEPRSVVIIEVVDSLSDELRIRERELTAGNSEFVENFDPESSGSVTLVLSRALGEAADARTGAALGSATAVQLVGEAALSGRSHAVPAVSAEGFFDELAELGAASSAEGDGILFVSPVRDGSDELVAVAVAHVGADQLLEGSSASSVALELLVDQVPLLATTVSDERGEPFGDPVVFTEGRATWAVQGYAAGVAVTRRGSWSALLIGLSLAVGGALMASAARRYAITLGHLERSQFDARHDPLTGLLNRAGLTGDLQRVLDERQPGELLAVLFLDLDRLKVINDSLGHSAGDQVLIEIGRRLATTARHDDIVGRFGGDEFVVVTSGGVSVPAAQSSSPSPGAVMDLLDPIEFLARRLLDAVGEAIVLDDESSQAVSASIGIAYVSEDEDLSAEDLLRDADLAMYRAKEIGGSRIEVFDAELRSRALARLEVERELRRAIRTGQLVVYYQPIIATEDGRVDRFEALVRWQHPERGMIPPGQFLSVAAESGLIVELGEHVLRESCRQAALWSAASNRRIRISVNLAERQLLDRNLVPTVRRVLAETGIEPSQLELELTEDLLVERMEDHLSVLGELSSMGIKLAIDDFGTSRASLGQLKKLAMVDTLKIDRSFVVDVANDSVDRKIIHAIVALAESVGMEVVVEGVEYAEQVAALRQLGVGLIQGFYFQRPGPAERALHSLGRTFEVPEVAFFADVN